MFKKLKTITNKLLALGIVVAVLIVILVGLDIYQKAKQKEGLSDNNVLKASKEKIVDYEIKSQGNNSNVVVYSYVSTQPVPAETYQGLKEDLSKRTPNSQTFLKSVTPIDEQTQQEEYVSKFYSSPTFQKEGDTWYQIETAATTPVAFASQTKLTLLDEVKELLGHKVLADQFFAGAGDGEVEKSDDSDWATTHDAITGETATPVATTGDTKTGKNLISGNYNISRLFLPFNTSAIPSNASVVSASISVYVTSTTDLDNDGDDYINVVQTSQPNSTTFTTADYDLAGAVSNPTTGATAIDLTAGFTASAYNTFTLNSTGISWIKTGGQNSACGTTTGVTCLGLREGHDIINSAYTGTGNNSIIVSTSEEAGTSQDPYLTVTYTIVAPNVISINGGTIKVD
mgnify:FL=1